MPRKSRKRSIAQPEQAESGLAFDEEARRIAESYDPVTEGTPEEREALLHPPRKGYMGRPYVALKSSELDAVAQKIDAVGAVALDLTDAPDRLNRIRRWMLEDETFERDLWLSIRQRAVKFGARDSLKLVMRLMYGWRENDDVAKQLEGHTVDEARTALRTVEEASTLTMHDIAENALTFLRAYFRKHPDQFDRVIAEIQAMERG